MKDEREKLLGLRKQHEEACMAMDEVEVYFLATGCRYRNSNYTCGHGRHNMKKYPQHIPTPPECNPKVCPRN